MVMNGIVRIYPTDRSLLTEDFANYFAVLSNSFFGQTKCTEEKLFESHFDLIDNADQFANASKQIIKSLGFNVAVDVQLIDSCQSE